MFCQRSSQLKKERGIIHYKHKEILSISLIIINPPPIFHLTNNNHLSVLHNKIMITIHFFYNRSTKLWTFFSSKNKILKIEKINKTNLISAIYQTKQVLATQTTKGVLTQKYNMIYKNKINLNQKLFKNFIKILFKCLQIKIFLKNWILASNL